MWLLDTNVVIGLFGGDATIVSELRRRRPAQVVTSAVVMHELYYGASKGLPERLAENLRRIDALRFEVLSFEPEDARHAGEIRGGLASLGTPIGPYDVLIAGQARARGITLVTRNAREFDRVPTLVVETW